MTPYHYMTPEKLRGVYTQAQAKVEIAMGRVMLAKPGEQRSFRAGVLFNDLVRKDLIVKVAAHRGIDLPA